MRLALPCLTQTRKIGKHVVAHVYCAMNNALRCISDERDELVRQITENPGLRVAISAYDALAAASGLPLLTTEDIGDVVDDLSDNFFNFEEVSADVKDQSSLDWGL